MPIVTYRYKDLFRREEFRGHVLPYSSLDG